ncbi:Uncharacterised protein [Mycobacteroides abscessus subsp. abscessus]|nr:Uncharacterised protein [Mycobacteroides abscessus subsp. abscessus]
MTSRDTVVGGTRCGTAPASFVPSSASPAAGLLRPAVASSVRAAGFSTVRSTATTALKPMRPTRSTPRSAPSTSSGMRGSEASAIRSAIDLPGASDNWAGVLPWMSCSATAAAVLIEVKASASAMEPSAVTGSPPLIRAWPAMFATARRIGASAGASHARSPAAQKLATRPVRAAKFAARSRSGPMPPPGAGAGGSAGSAASRCPWVPGAGSGVRLPGEPGNRGAFGFRVGSPNSATAATRSAGTTPAPSPTSWANIEATWAPCE